MVRLGQAVPALPVSDVVAAVGFYGSRFGFTCLHLDTGLAVLLRDDVRVHLWQAADDSWRTRTDFVAVPVRSGAEGFLAGTASCRIETDDVDGLHVELRATGVLHPVSVHGVTTTDFGTREFAALDLDGNLLEFFRWVR